MEAEVYTVQGKGPSGVWIELAQGKNLQAAKLLRSRLEMTMQGEPVEFRIQNDLGAWRATLA